MGAAIIDIADAVVAAVNGHTFSSPYNAALGATRLYVPVYNLTELNTLKVTVAASAESSGLAARNKMQENAYDIDIGFQKKLTAPIDATTATKADLDAIFRLIQEVGDFLFQMDELTVAGLPTGETGVTPIGLSSDPLYDSRRLDEYAELLAVRTITYRGYR